MEVAPPQFVNVMGHRTTKMLDTIKEEEKDVSGNDSVSSPMKNFSTSVSPSSSCSASAADITKDSKYFLRGVPHSFSIFENN